MVRSHLRPSLLRQLHQPRKPKMARRQRLPSLKRTRRTNPLRPSCRVLARKRPLLQRLALRRQRQRQARLRLRRAVHLCPLLLDQRPRDRRPRDRRLPVYQHDQGLLASRAVLAHLARQACPAHQQEGLRRAGLCRVRQGANCPCETGPPGPFPSRDRPHLRQTPRIRPPQRSNPAQPSHRRLNPAHLHPDRAGLDRRRFRHLSLHRNQRRLTSLKKRMGRKNPRQMRLRSPQL
jgi:hypothetical protein